MTNTVEQRPRKLLDRVREKISTAISFNRDRHLKSQKAIATKNGQTLRSAHLKLRKLDNLETKHCPQCTNCDSAIRTIVIGIKDELQIRSDSDVVRDWEVIE
jgi:hypothetical protein